MKFQTYETASGGKKIKGRIPISIGRRMGLELTTERYGDKVKKSNLIFTLL
jgi:hypothetical protein